MLLIIGNSENIQKTKIMASGPITSWKIDGETVERIFFNTYFGVVKSDPQKTFSFFNAEPKSMIHIQGISGEVGKGRQWG